MEIINTERVPLYVFTDPAKIEKDCLQQARNMSNLTVAYHHTALMPDAHIGYIAFGWVTEGQLLSLPLVAVGLGLLWYAYRTGPSRR